MVQVIQELSHPNAYGQVIVDRPGYYAQFNQNDVTAADLEFAERVLVSEGINGRTLELDEVTLSPLIQRVSVFDTDEQARRERWATRTHTDEYGNEHNFKDYVERWLADRSQNHPDFRMIEEAPLEPPWPNYLDYRGSLDSLISRLIEDGFDLGRVLAFEEKVGHRDAVIERLRAELARRREEARGTEVVPA